MAKASPSKKRLLRALVVEDDPGMRQLIVGLMETAAGGQRRVGHDGEVTSPTDSSSGTGQD